MKSGRRFSNEQIMKRREIVSELYLKGLTMRQMGAEVGVSHQQICEDLKHIRAEWRSSTIRNFDEAKSLELARLDQIEAEAWRAWERSQGKHVTTKTESGTGAQGAIDKTSETTEDLAGDPRFLDAIAKCVQKRCDILGLDAPKSITGAGGGPIAFMFNSPPPPWAPNANS